VSLIVVIENCWCTLQHFPHGNQLIENITKRLISDNFLGIKLKEGRGYQQQYHHPFVRLIKKLNLQTVCRNLGYFATRLMLHYR
jgi:hypothetical protein